jgi:hypothetical protein
MIARISISEENFAALVRGEIVKDTGANGRLIVEIALSDIGLERMRQIVEAAVVAKALCEGQSGIMPPTKRV